MALHKGKIMKYNGIIKGSKTIDFGLLVGVFGMIELNLPIVKDQLGDYYGWVFMGISAAVIVLRKMTNKPLGEK